MDICTTLCVLLLSFRDEWYVSINPYLSPSRRHVYAGHEGDAGGVASVMRVK